MANVQLASPSALQPTISALKAVQAALATFAATPGIANDNKNALGTDAGTTSAAYINYVAVANLVQIQLDTLESIQTTDTVTPSGGSLYELASMFYSDITQAFTLMAANGMSTPWLANGVNPSINIPTPQTLMPAYGISAAQVTPS